MSMIRWYNPGAGRGRSVSDQPFMTITKRCAFVFSSKIVKEINMREYDYARLCYDAKQMRIGILVDRLETARPSYSYKIGKGFTVSVCGQSFIRDFKLEMCKGKHFKAWWDDEEGMIVVDLKEEVKKG